MSDQDETGEHASPDDRVTRFTSDISRFLATSEALRDLLTVILPHAQQLDEPMYAATPILLGIENEGERDRVRQALNDVVEKFQKLPPGNYSFPISQLGEEEQASATELERQVDVAFRRLFESSENVPVLAKLLSIVLRTIRRHPRKRLLLTSLIASLTSGFELLIAALAKHYYSLQPSAMGTDEKEFSLGDLAGFATIQDARDAAVSRRVDELLWKSFEEWGEWFERRQKLSFSRLSYDWPHTQEVFQRRNCIVHSGGRASRPYVEWAQRVLSTRIEVGAALRVDEEYAASAIDRVTTLGVLLGVASGLKLLPEHRDAVGGVLSGHVYDQMLLGRWRAVEALCRIGITLPCADRDEEVLRVNFWLARKRLGELESERHNIETWDTSALAPEFELARLALLDRVDEALALLKRLIATEQLPTDAAREWPLFEELRADTRFPELIVEVERRDEQGR